MYCEIQKFTINYLYLQCSVSHYYNKITMHSITILRVLKFEGHLITFSARYGTVPPNIIFNIRYG